MGNTDHDQRAAELLESWVNGNRKWVIGELIEERPLRAMILSSILIGTLRAYGDDAIFLRMLNSRLEDENG